MGRGETAMTIRRISFILALIVAAATYSQEPRGIYIIFDGSGSMRGRLPDSTHKITATRQVLTGFAAGDFPGSEVALRAYGHRTKGDCKDSELMIPFGEIILITGGIETCGEDPSDLVRAWRESSPTG